MNSEILEHLKSVVNSLNVKDKNKLSKIYFQITGSDYIAKINLENLKYSEDSEYSNDSLIIMMDEATFFELKNNIIINLNIKLRKRSLFQFLHFHYYLSRE